MNKLTIFFLLVVVLVVGIYSAASIYINTHAKKILVDKIKENTGLEATVRSISLKFPFGVQVRGFDCAGLAVKKLTIYPDIIKVTMICVLNL